MKLFKVEDIPLGRWLLGLFVVAMVIALLLPFYSPRKGKSPWFQCSENLKSLAIGASIYSMDNNDLLPPASNWAEAISIYVRNPEEFHCPTTSPKLAYALNKSLSGAKHNPSNQVDLRPMLFESELSGNNPAGGPSDVSFRHGGVVAIAFTDTRLKRYKPEELSSLKWTATAPSP